MRSLVLLTLLLSTSAFASELLLKKHAVSGLMIPENSFEKDCSVYSSGLVRLRLREGINPPRIVRKLVSQRQITLLKQNLRKARFGKIVDGDIICDAGSRTVYGYLRGKKILIDEDLDCNTHRINECAAAGRIVSFGFRVCEFL